MASIFKTALSIRLFGDDLDPDEISRLLGAAPSESYRKGDLRETPMGGKIIKKTGSWTLRAEERSPGDLSAQIVEVLCRLTPDLSVWEALGQRYRCDLFCGLFMEEGNEGEELTVEALTMLSERGLKLQIDIYTPPHDEKNRSSR